MSKSQVVRDVDQRLLNGVMHADWAAARAAMALGADVNVAAVDSRDSENWRPLHWAAARGNVEICRALIAFGCDVNGRTRNGRSALQLAAGHGCVSVCDLLIASGAEVNAADDRGSTPLHAAAEARQVAACAALLGAGADADLADAAGLRAEDCAMDVGVKAVFLAHRARCSPHP